MTADGRLSPEELDELLGGSGSGRTVVATGQPDELVAGPGSTDGEHRVPRPGATYRAAAVVAVVLLLVAAGAWWRSSQVMPAPTGSISATVVVSWVGGEGEVVRTRLAVTPSHPGTPLRALALQGMGLSQPTVTQDGDAVQASNVVACSTVGDLTTRGAYTLRVTSSDSAGAEVARDLPLAGDGDRRLTSVVVDTCVEDAARGMEFRYFAASLHGPARLRLSLFNPAPWDLYVYGAEASVGPRAGAEGPGRFATQGGPVRLPAGDVVLVSLVPRPGRCTAWLGPVRWQPAPGEPAADFTLFVGPAGVPPGTAAIARPGFGLFPAQRAAVVRALRMPCAG